MGFARGRLIMHRNVRHHRIGWVRPVRVVSDDHRGLLVWLDRGTEVVNEIAADGRGMREMPFGEWAGLDYRLEHGIWQGPGVLKFMPVGVAHSVWWFRDDDGNFTGWYVNLEDPARRWDDGTVAGVDMVDQDLDIVVGPDRRWHWKDEDEFTERLAFPDHYWVPDADAVWAEGKRVIEQIEAGEFPFDGSWTDFRPDPSWVPGAPLPGWDRPVLER